MVALSFLSQQRGEGFLEEKEKEGFHFEKFVYRRRQKPKKSVEYRNCVSNMGRNISGPVFRVWNFTKPDINP
jgi:hypothetical protein